MESNTSVYGFAAVGVNPLTVPPVVVESIHRYISVAVSLHTYKNCKCSIRFLKFYQNHIFSLKLIFSSLLLL
jgi:hypothetical protein